MVTKIVSQFPDIATEANPSYSSTLDKVGMENVELPIKIQNVSGEIEKYPAHCNFFVNLNKADTKGIHMSRLYLIAQEILSSNHLNFHTIEKLLNELIKSHSEISSSAAVSINWEAMIEREALVSDKKGWRFYPVTLSGTRNEIGVYTYQLQVKVAYSSTCPCSAALSRQLNQKEFIEKFGSQDSVSIEAVHEWLGTQESQVATPHSQRSYADVIVKFGTAEDAKEATYIINILENALKTSVQAAVKREDEQEFARLNARNLMFSEDAGRLIKSVLDKEPSIIDYKIHVQHIESLHPHDAVVITTKGLPNGLKA